MRARDSGRMLAARPRNRRRGEREAVGEAAMSAVVRPLTRGAAGIMTAARPACAAGAHRVGAGEVVADALAARGQQRHRHGEHARGHVDLEHADERADEGVPQRHRAAVVADDAQPSGEAPKRAAARERLLGRGYPNKARRP